MGCATSLPEKWLDVTDGSCVVPETQASIVKIYYFEEIWGRKSAMEFMMDYKGIPFEVEPISVLAYYSWMKKKLGGLPVCQRRDGTLMNETQPCTRYIARHNNLYPTKPIEIYWCDRIS